MRQVANRPAREPTTSELSAYELGRQLYFNRQRVRVTEVIRREVRPQEDGEPVLIEEHMWIEETY